MSDPADGGATSAAGWRAVLLLAWDRGVPGRAVRIALLVGTVLNLVNQGDILLAGRAPDLLKAALTYCIPFFVSGWGAIATLRAISSLSCKQTLNGD